MAKSPTEQIRELAAALAELSAKLQILIAQVAAQEKDIEKGTRRNEEFVARSAVTDERVNQLRTEVNALREELRRATERLAVSEAKNAALEERARNQEKTADRGWQLWLAALGFGFGLLSLLVTAALQLKK